MIVQTQQICSKDLGHLLHLVVLGVVVVHAGARGPGEESLVVRCVDSEH